MKLKIKMYDPGIKRVVQFSVSASTRNSLVIHEVYFAAVVIQRLDILRYSSAIDQNFALIFE